MCPAVEWHAFRQYSHNGVIINWLINQSLPVREMWARRWAIDDPSNTRWIVDTICIDDVAPQKAFGPFPAVAGYQFCTVSFTREFLTIRNFLILFVAELAILLAVSKRYGRHTLVDTLWLVSWYETKIAVAHVRMRLTTDLWFVLVAHFLLNYCSLLCCSMVMVTASCPALPEMRTWDWFISINELIN